jgi:hypothetical protein
MLGVSFNGFVYLKSFRRVVKLFSRRSTVLGIVVLGRRDGGGEGWEVRGPKYCSSSVSRRSGEERTCCSGEEDMTMTESWFGKVRFRFGGVRWTERIACVDCGKCDDNDMVLQERDRDDGKTRRYPSRELTVEGLGQDLCCAN